MSDRWAEYEAGTLTPPVIVQHDALYEGTDREEHLICVYTANGLRGPWTFKTYDATATLAAIVEQLAAEEAAANAEEFMEP